MFFVFLENMKNGHRTVFSADEMAPLFSKIDSNKLWHDVQHEESVICAQFGKDLFNISKVIGRSKVAQFFDSHCSTVWLHLDTFSLTEDVLLLYHRPQDSSTPGKTVLQ